MKKFLFILLMIITMAFLFCGCAKKNTMGKGKTMILNFEENASTGYQWSYEFLKDDDKATIVLDNEDYITNEDLNIVGAPGRHIYYFKATKPGKQNLTFTYRRPWEGGDVAYDVVYELNVDKDLNIECLSKMKGQVKSDVELSFFPNPIFE